MLLWVDVTFCVYPFASSPLECMKTWRCSFNLETEEVTGEWRKLHTQVLKNYILEYVLFFFSLAQQPNSVLDGLIVEVSRSHTIRHTYKCTHASTHHRTPLNGWSAHHRAHYLHNTQQAQETNMHALSGIWTSDPSNQAAADLCFRPCDHRN
jgi:hypothetical protein